MIAATSGWRVVHCRPYTVLGRGGSHSVRRRSDCLNYSHRCVSQPRLALATSFVCTCLIEGCCSGTKRAFSKLAGLARLCPKLHMNSSLQFIVRPMIVHYRHRLPFDNPTAQLTLFRHDLYRDRL